MKRQADDDPELPFAKADVNLTLDENEQTVRDLFAAFFLTESPLSVVRRAEPLGFDPKLWQKLVSIGAPEMGIPIGQGGGGATMQELTIVAEEYGRRLAPVPIIESITTGRLLANCEDSPFLDSVMDGSILATISLSPARNGRCRLVPGGAIADVVIALDGQQLVALRKTKGQSDSTVHMNLGCSPLADWPTDVGVTRHILATDVNARMLYADALTTWRLLMASALVGLGARALDIVVNYVQDRRAFGVPIGAFQAVRHRLADVAVAGDGGELLVREAAWSYDQRNSDAQQLVAMAFIFLAETTFRTCREALQFHGGYGVTLENDIQLYFRRAKAWPLAIGDISQQYRVLGDLLLPRVTSRA